MSNHISTGKRGEQIAKQFLATQGYQILESNWRFSHCEVDLICKKAEELIFVEVKTRTGQQFGQPEESVTSKKQLLLAKAADEYIYQNQFDGEIRFDILSIFLSKDNHTIHHFEDAFFPIL